MAKQRLFRIGALIIVIVLIAWAGIAMIGSPSMTRNSTATGGMSAAPAAPAAQDSAAEMSPGSAQNTNTSAKNTQPSPENQALVGRMVIRSARLTLSVEKVDAAESQARSLVQERGGYILSSTTNGDSNDRTVRLTLKVPVERFDDMINSLEGLAVKVRDRTVSGEDVTEEFVDTEARLRNLRATETRLLQFMKDAKSVEEALLVNQQLTDLQGQIEQLSGRVTYLKQSTAYSMIDVNFLPTSISSSLVNDGWTPATAAITAWHGLLAFAQNAADVLIVLAVWFPVWGIVALVVTLVWRKLSRRTPIPPITPS